MAITLVQSNGSASTGTLDATPPAWGTPTTAGNLLIIVGNEVNITTGAWGTTPSGYTAFPTNAFTWYTTGIGGVHGGYWKIAAGSDATPGHWGETSSTQDYVTYTYEFACTTGWVASAIDKEVHSAATTVATTSKASGATATLSQPVELILGMCHTQVAVTALSFASNPYTLATPGTANGKLRCGWIEVNGICTFKAAAAASGPRPRQSVKRLVRSGA
jgi:hypothetical protein